MTTGGVSGEEKISQRVEENHPSPSSAVLKLSGERADVSEGTFDNGLTW